MASRLAREGPGAAAGPLSLFLLPGNGAPRNRASSRAFAAGRGRSAAVVDQGDSAGGPATVGNSGSELDRSRGLVA